MEHTNPQFDIKMVIEENFLLVIASGIYSLIKANNLFKFAIDNGVSQNKSNILIDVINISGSIPFFDRFKYSEFLANYVGMNAATKIIRVAVAGQEPIVHKEKFGETAAVNRGANVRVFTDMNKALIWVNEK